MQVTTFQELLSNPGSFEQEGHSFSLQEELKQGFEQNEKSVSRQNEAAFMLSSTKLTIKTELSRIFRLQS